MKYDLETLYKEDPVKACKKAIERTRDVDWKERIDKINTILHGYGVEAIRGEWQNGYWCDIVASYVNMGDTYAITVINARDKGFLVMSVGDFVETYQNFYDIK